jgi:DNA-binding PadR family transcriptional regulator
VDERARSGRGEGGPRGRMGRGDVRNLLLAALLSGPGHGYELMRRLEERSDGRWRPSPGSVYPSLQLLEEQGLVRSSEVEGRNVFDLTAEGQQQADGELLRGLAGDDGPSEHSHALRDAVGQLHMAVKQIRVAGDPAQIEQAAEIIHGARRAIYRLLASK